MLKLITLKNEMRIKNFFSVSFVRRHLSIGHIDTHRNQSFECDKCPKAFVSRHYLKLHIKNVHTAPRDLLCPHCGHAYRTLCTLNNHRVGAFNATSAERNSKTIVGLRGTCQCMKKVRDLSRL